MQIAAVCSLIALPLSAAADPGNGWKVSSAGRGGAAREADERSRDEEMQLVSWLWKSFRKGGDFPLNVDGQPHEVPLKVSSRFEADVSEDMVDEDTVVVRGIDDDDNAVVLSLTPTESQVIVSTPNDVSHRTVLPRDAARNGSSPLHRATQRSSLNLRTSSHSDGGRTMRRRATRHLVQRTPRSTRLPAGAFTTRSMRTPTRGAQRVCRSTCSSTMAAIALGCRPRCMRAATTGPTVVPVARRT